MTRPLAGLAVTAALALFGAEGNAAPAREAALPSSLVILGHSGSTGFRSDPTRPERDATENSWATGTNPVVRSVYLRILARNPRIRGHNVNLAVDGATAVGMLAQASRAVRVRPKPDLVLIEIHDNDIRCDGTDSANYPPFRRTFASALRTLADALPRARIFVVSSWSSPAAYARMLASLKPADRVRFRGDGPCDFYDLRGRPRPANVAYLQRVIDGYERQMAAECARIARCRTDGGGLSRLPTSRRDLADDLGHPSVFGHSRKAAAVWAALRLT